MITTRRARGRLRIGTSGYQYDHWQGVFYPEDLRKKEWFGYYCRYFDTVEINNTFYNLPEAKTFDAWRKAVSDDFCYVLKYSRYGSHIKKLKDPKQHVDRFVERASRLGPRLGPVLVQLPDRWKPAADRLDAFLEAVPDTWRWALEFRDRRWLNEEVYQVLRKHRAALCIHDMIRQHPEEITAEWVYLRFHGKNGGAYGSNELGETARRIAGYLKQGLDTYVFFNNDAGGHAVYNALELKRDLENEADL